jgi:hypothetical protein
MPAYNLTVTYSGKAQLSVIDRSRQSAETTVRELVKAAVKKVVENSTTLTKQGFPDKERWRVILPQIWLEGDTVHVEVFCEDPPPAGQEMS